MIERILGLPAAASAHAADLDLILGLVHVLMAVILAGWGTFLVVTLVRFRHGRNPVASYAGIRGRGTVWTEAAIVAAEVVILAGFSIPAWATRVHRVPDEHEATVVRVVAEQFAWNVHYPGADGAFGSTDASLIDAGNPLGIVPGSGHGADDVRAVNELVVPVGRPVIVQLTAKDVIHSFGVPAMRVKRTRFPA